MRISYWSSDVCSSYLDAVQKFVQRLARLQRPQPRRVGRGNVYGEIAREAGHRPRALGIIGDSVVRVLVCADVDADDAGPAMPPREPMRRRCLAAVVEAHSVDYGAVPRQKIGRTSCREHGCQYG